MKTSQKARQRNKAVKTVIRGTLKDYKADQDKTTDKLKVVAKVLDQAASNKVIHKNKAARLKSRMAKLAKKAG
jgi:small subunit ribosomal protein S20